MEGQRLSYIEQQRDPRSEARLGQLRTRRGTMPTPVFMPVGTLGTVKAMDPLEVAGLGFSLVLGNTYHLMLRPGTAIVRAHGSLHGFMGFDGSILTDSGGYQVFSLARHRTIREEGVTFQSHIDGAQQQLSPESAIAIQEDLGSDIMMVLDECPPHDAPVAYLEQSMARTTRWADRCLAARSASGGALFGIVQGGLDLGLRKAHLEDLAARPFDGLAIGGLSVGEGALAMESVLSEVVPRMPRDRPRYLMGVGLPQDILLSVLYGVDMFDCVVPTRNARNGQLFTWDGPLAIKASAHQADTNPVDPSCPCPSCTRFSRSYLRHLYKCDEILGVRLNTLHNLTFYARLMEAVREHIRRGDYAAWSREAIGRMTKNPDWPRAIAQN